MVGEEQGSGGVGGGWPGLHLLGGPEERKSLGKYPNTLSCLVESVSFVRWESDLCVRNCDKNDRV